MLGDDVTRDALRDEVFDHLYNTHGQGRSDGAKPLLMVGMRGDDLLVFASGGRQICILFVDAIEPPARLKGA